MHLHTRCFHSCVYRRIIHPLTHFAEDKLIILIIYLVHRLPILRVMRESTFESTSLLVWQVSKSNASIGTPCQTFQAINILNVQQMPPDID